MEQDRCLLDDPTILVSVTVNGIEQYCWLTRSEAQMLHQTLGHALTQTRTEPQG